MGNPLEGDSNTAQVAVYGHNTDAGNGVIGESQLAEGVRGISHNPNHGGVVGICDAAGGNGVFGTCDSGTGVIGESKSGTGVFGESEAGEGVHGISHNPNHGGVVGISDAVGGNGVFGTCDAGTGVVGESKSGTGVFGESQAREGVRGVSHTLNSSGVSGHNPGGLAGFFDGNVTVTGSLLLGGGVSSNGGGLKHLRVPISVPFGGGFFQIDWPSPFPDANYTVVGSVEDPQINVGIQLQFVNLFLKKASSVNVFIANANETSKNAVIDLVAMHD
jgi:hypothetical protein